MSFYAYLQSTGINRLKMLFDEGISSEHFNAIDMDLKESLYIQKHYIIYDSTGTVLYKSKYAVPHLNEKLKQTVFKAKITAQKDGFERIIFANKENKKHRLFKSTSLTAKEYALLEYLMINHNRVVSRVDIAEKVWDTDLDSFSNTIDNYINFLRKKVDHGFPIKLIHTVVGMGYMLKEKD